MSNNYRELYNIEKHRNAGLKGENTRLRKTNAALQEDLNQLNKLLASSIPVIWHDLTKNPNDIPIQEKNEKWHIVLDNFGNKCFYDNLINKWRRPETWDIIEPTAWCEVPTLKK